MLTDHPDIQLFTQSLQQIYRCDFNDSALLARQFSVRSLAEKGHLIEAGQVAQEVFFIAEGILRIYYIDREGNEANQQFYQSGEVIAPVFSLTTSEPSPFYLQALTPARVLVADYQKLHLAGEDNLAWLRVENALLKAVFLKTARREAQMLLGDAEQRYRWFLKENPQLAEQLPLYQIASYLGVTPVSLSRVRKKLSQSLAKTD